MSANTLPTTPPFLDGLSEADRFLAVVRCVRKLQMHSILTPEIRTLGDLGLRLIVGQLISNQRDIEAQILEAETQRKNDIGRYRVWGPDNELEESDNEANFYLSSDDSVPISPRQPNNTPTSEADADAPTAIDRQMPTEGPSSDMIVEPGTDDKGWSSDEVVVSIEDEDGNTEYMSIGRVEDFCVCDSRFGLNEDSDNAFYHDLRCPVRRR